jgi:hypothetical protein
MAKKEIIVKESSEVIANCDNLPQGVVESGILLGILFTKNTSYTTVEGIFAEGTTPER